MRNRVALCALGVLLLCSGRVLAQVPPETTSVELMLNFWAPEPEIVLEEVDFATTLEIEKKRFREFRVRAGGAHKFRFSYVPIKYDDTGKVISTTVTFRGVTYPVNVPVNYEVKWDLYRIGYEWDFARFQYGFIGVIAELKYNKVTAFIEAQAIGSEATEANPLIPTVGGIARGYLGDYVSVTAEFTGLKLNREELVGKFYDFDLYGQVNLTKNLAGQFGYRSLDVDYLVDGEAGLLKFKGPYFGATLRF